MRLAAIIRAMVNSGSTPEQIAAVVEAAEAETIAADEQRRTKAREKKRRQRAGLSPSVPGTQGDGGGQSPPLKESSPTPPKENTPPPLSVAIAPDSETRAPVPEPALRIEFDMTFWPAYPHKVGRPAALRAFIAKRQGASLAEIMNGLARYKSDRPPDRQWLNPETFLNDERFRDEPAPAPVPNGARPNGHDAILRALARQASEGDPAGEWAPGAPARHDDSGEGAPADFGAGDGLPRPALAGPR